MYKIMIVDDDPTSLAIGQALLEGKYELTLARSGVQALGYLNADTLPDLVLLDMVMPGLNGIEVLKTLKESERLKDIPVIFLTGEANKAEILASYGNGAADFLEKPVNPELLNIRLQQQIQYLELRRENKRLRGNLQLLKEKFEELFPSEPEQ